LKYFIHYLLFLLLFLLILYYNSSRVLSKNNKKRPPHNEKEKKERFFYVDNFCQRVCQKQVENVDNFLFTFKIGDNLWITFVFQLAKWKGKKQENENRYTRTGSEKNFYKTDKLLVRDFFSKRRDPLCGSLFLTAFAPL